MTNINPRQVVENVLSKIKERPDTWCRFTIDDGNGRHCLRGFIIGELGSTDGYVSTEETEVAKFLGFEGESRDPVYGLCEWNNQVDSVDEIIDLLQRSLE